MRIKSLIKEYWKLTCVIVACWTFLALLFTPQTYLSNLRSPTPLTWARAFVATLILFQVWALLTPFLLWLGGRFPLETQRTQEVTLKEEIDFLEKYLEIQQTLMRDRLRVRLNVEHETLDASVPNMLLQPLVENAIKHGISPRPEGGNIEVYARRLDDKLYVEITDDGLGMNEQHDGSGVGLVNTRERLKHLYGHAQAFNLRSFPGRGVTIRISLPFREAENKRDDTNGDQDLVLQDGQHLMLSRKYRDRFLAALGDV